MQSSARLLNLAANLRLSIPEQSIRRGELYRSLGATSPEVIRLAGLAPDPFGHQSERLLIQQLGLKPRLSTEHDAICPSTGARVEIKCARFALTSTPENLKYSWTRIYPARSKFDILLLGLLDLRGFRVWELNRQTVHSLLLDTNPNGNTNTTNTNINTISSQIFNSKINLTNLTRILIH